MPYRIVFESTPKESGTAASPGDLSSVPLGPYAIELPLGQRPICYFNASLYVLCIAISMDPLTAKGPSAVCKVAQDNQ